MKEIYHHMSYNLSIHNTHLNQMVRENNLHNAFYLLEHQTYCQSCPFVATHSSGQQPVQISADGV